MLYFNRFALAFFAATNSLLSLSGIRLFVFNAHVPVTLSKNEQTRLRIFLLRLKNTVTECYITLPGDKKGIPVPPTARHAINNGPPFSIMPVSIIKCIFAP